MPRLSIPAKGANGRSLNPEDIQIGSAHPNNSEKWLIKELAKEEKNQLVFRVKPSHKGEKETTCST